MRLFPYEWQGKHLECESICCTGSGCAKRCTVEINSVLIGLCGDNTISGPLCFDNHVNRLVYLDMINNNIVPELHQRYGTFRNGAIPRKWWVQGGAPAHHWILVQDHLQQLYPNNVNGVCHNQVYPPRSPDLTHLDFYLWGYLKMKVFQTPPANLQHLRKRIVGICRLWGGPSRWNQHFRTWVKELGGVWY